MTADCKFSIIVLGESGVGKTSLLLRYTTQTFKEFRTSTMIDCLHKVIKIQEKKIKLELWDTAGQDRFRSIVRGYYRLADGVCLVYDVSNIMTFNKLTSWLEELRQHNETAVTVIVGNKSDDPNRRAVSLSTVERYAEEEKLPYMETSAKNGDNVDEIFEYLANQILINKGLVPKPVISVNDLSAKEHVASSEEESSLASSKFSDKKNSTDENKQNSTASSFCVEKCSVDSNTESSFSILPVSKTDSLPPIVPLPKDSIKLHLEKKRKKESKSGCC